MFRIDYDPRADRLHIHVSGFWTIENVSPFAAAIGAKLQEVRRVSTDFDVLVESMDFPVQANEVADLMPSIMQAGFTITTGRAAVVVGSLLNKMQVDRTLVHARLKSFLTVSEAEAWLEAAPQPTTSTAPNSENRSST